MLAVAQKNFALMQGDLPFRPINVIAKTVGNVGELAVRHESRERWQRKLR
jgi:hypothetical protein